MRFEKKPIIINEPANAWTTECFNIVRNYLEDLERPDGEKEILYKGDRLEDLFKSMGDLINRSLSSHSCPRVAIVYHRDLDGGTAGIVAAGFIKAIYSALFGTDRNLSLEMISMNYNDRLYERTRKVLRNADLVISTDYSCSNTDHMQAIFGLTDNMKNIVYIDHHQSSVKAAQDNKLFKGFLNEPNVEYIIAERDNCSAALLTYLMCIGLTKTMYEYPKHVLDLLQDNESDMAIAVARSVPEYIMHVSLYDTFSKLAAREFSLGVNTIKHMPFELCENIKEDEDIFTHDIDSAWYKDMFRFFNITISTDVELVADMYYTRPFEVNPEKTLDTAVTKADLLRFSGMKDILTNGTLIKDYDVSIHNMCRRRNEFEVMLIFNDGSGEKSYNVAVINGFGNSFLFEESYYNHDGVILFTLDKNLNYVYSFFADKHSDNPNRLPCCKIAECLGGGGHATAAGCTIPRNLFDLYGGLIENSSEGKYVLDLSDQCVLSDFLDSIYGK